MTSHDLPLGRRVDYPSAYDAALLFPIARDASGPRPDVPFVGEDIWNAYELGWLDPHGKPRVALAEFRVPADSHNLIESKSLKLYLQGFAQTRFADGEAVRACMQHDLSVAAGAPVSAVLTTVATAAKLTTFEQLEGTVIDDLPLDIDHYGPPRPEFLSADAGVVVDESLVSHLLKSNCPVTSQPDWASVQIRYRGPRIDREALLRYLVSFRTHHEFHEQCVERIFADLMQQCTPSRLSVYARYTRRGGLDINPFRATPGTPMPDNPRSVRQ
jgi:7-cyano-7-deazaguanine reductase